jgi:hypothetical protein
MCVAWHSSLSTVHFINNRTIRYILCASTATSRRETEERTKNDRQPEVKIFLYDFARVCRCMRVFAFFGLSIPKSFAKACGWRLGYILVSNTIRSNPGMRLIITVRKVNLKS